MTTISPPVTGVDFVGIPVRDLEASSRFYELVLGFASDYRWGEVGLEFQVGNLTLALMDMEKLGLEFAASGAPIALHVDDVDAQRKRLEAAGVEFVQQFDSGVCHQAIFRDPDGNPLVLHHRYAPR